MEKKGVWSILVLFAMWATAKQTHNIMCTCLELKQCLFDRGVVMRVTFQAS